MIIAGCSYSVSRPSITSNTFFNSKCKFEAIHDSLAGELSQLLLKQCLLRVLISLLLMEDTCRLLLLPSTVRVELAPSNISTSSFESWMVLLIWFTLSTPNASFFVSCCREVTLLDWALPEFKISIPYPLFFTWIIRRWSQTISSSMTSSVFLLSAWKSVWIRAMLCCGDGFLLTSVLEKSKS